MTTVAVLDLAIIIDRIDILKQLISPFLLPSKDCVSLRQLIICQCQKLILACFLKLVIHSLFSLYLSFKKMFMTMTGFELRNCDIGIDHSASWATTTTVMLANLVRLLWWWQIPECRSKTMATNKAVQQQQQQYNWHH